MKEIEKIYKIPLVLELSKLQKAGIKGCINMIPKLNVNLKKKFFIIGDKGYIIKKIFKYNNFFFLIYIYIYNVYLHYCRKI